MAFASISLQLPVKLSVILPILGRSFDLLNAQLGYHGMGLFDFNQPIEQK